MKQLHTITAVMLVLLLHQNSSAQLIQTFGFPGAAGNEATFPPNGQPANGVIGSMKRGSGITPSAAGNVFAATGFTTNASVDTADYFSFSIKANQGFKLNLDSIVFGQRRSNSGPANYAVRSSLDGFQADLASGTCPTNITYNNMVTLGAAFQSVASAVTIDFRFYAFGAGATTGTWRLDSVRIHGTITQGGGGGGPVIKPKAGFSPASSSFTESDGNRTITAALTSAPSVSVSLAVFVKGGTASAGTDYTAFGSLPLNFSGTALQQSAQVAFLDDAVQESSETLTLVLRKQGLVSDTAFEIGPDSVFTFTILDNDAVVPPSGLLQQFNFTGKLGNEPTSPPDGQPVNGTLSDMSRGIGVSPGQGNGAFVSTGFTLDSVNIDTDDYFSFSIGSNQSFSLNLDSIVFGQRKSNTGPKKYQIKSSLDGFQNVLAAGLTPSGTTSNWNNRVLLGASFLSVPSTQLVEFRFYGFSANNAGGSWRLDSVRIYGSINLTTEIFGQSLPNSSLKLFPNPGSSLIKWSKLPPNCGSLEVMAMDGRILLSIPTPAVESAVDVSFLPEGVYFFRLPQMGLVSRWVKTRD